MTHKITFDRPFLSIKSLGEVDLPNFALVTGVNGSGKSHLLRALHSGSIKSDAIDHAGDDHVTLFAWDTLVPKEKSEAKPGELSEIGALIEERLNRFASPMGGLKVAISIDGSHKSVTCSQLLDYAIQDNGENRQWICDAIKNFLHSNGISARSSEQSQQRQRLYIDGLDNETIIRHVGALLGENDTARHNALQVLDQVTPKVFEQDLNRIFQRHRDLLNGNTIAKAYGLTERIIHFDEPAPWDFLNELFEQGNIRFRVDPPDYVAVNSSVRVTLRKVGSEAEISFANLSSGERIFISFALALYNTESAKTTAVFPKILLLDEIDATLHPSMVKYVLKVIKDTLVAKLGIKVVMTTHSPTTVALVEDDEVFEMNNDAGTLKRVGRSHALSLLTEAIPTLAIDYDARVLVVTEDESDAQLWSDLYRGLSRKLSSEMSLTFMGAGVKDKKGATVGGGCSRVRTITKQMSDAGFNRVTGLVDWDGKNTHIQGDAVHVLCEGQRYAIENLLLDPVLCIVLMCKFHADKAVVAGLMDQGEGFRSIDGWSVEQWQNKVNEYCKKVLPDAELSPVDQVQYANNHSLNIPLAYLRYNGHGLERKVKGGLPCFNEHRYQRGLLPEIVRLITSGDVADWYPQSIINTMEDLIRLCD